MHSARRQYFVMSTMAALFAALVLLAGLQYRWIGEAGRAELERTRAALRRAAEQFASEFDRELARPYLALVSGADPGDRDPLYDADRLNEWPSPSARPEWLRGVFLAEGGEAGLDTLLQLDAQGAFRPVPWPSEIEPLRADLLERVAGRPGPAFRGPPGSAADLPVLVAPRGRRSRPAGPMRRRLGLRQGPPPRVEGWVIALLDLEYIRRVWAPELVKKYFVVEGQPDYDVRIVSRSSGRTIYDSNPSAPARAFEKADAEAAMFPLHPPGSPGGPRAGGGAPGALSGPNPGRWRLLVRDRSGGIEATVARGRARNLAVSGAVLLIMAASLVVLLAAIRRSAQLATQQMQFVAAVSHELRTPLAVIRSAAENLADGIVTAGDSVRQYGALIREEGRRLSYLVEQTLRFAGIQTGRARYNLVPADVSGVIEDALKSCEGALRNSGCKVETRIGDALPPVLGDASALAVCVGNLLTNAARHAKSGGWIGVSAALSDSTVRVEVRDRGPGIEARDLPHIFEPFYRGRRAESDQLGGTGLGLALVRQIVAAHHGEVAVESKPGQGACFTLTLPAAAAADST